jgi:tripartite-type tricarboxylate transporter receptor subunit TctC
MSESAFHARFANCWRVAIHGARIGLLLAVALVSGMAVAQAQPADKYPSHAIKYVVPYPPGAFNDTMARIVSQKLQDAWAYRSWSKIVPAAER